MESSNFDGTLALEKLAELGLLDQFYEAIDSDRLEEVNKLLKSAGLEADSIKSILRQIIDDHHR